MLLTRGGQLPSRPRATDNYPHNGYPSLLPIFMLQVRFHSCRCRNLFVISAKNYMVNTWHCAGPPPGRWQPSPGAGAWWSRPSRCGPEHGDHTCCAAQMPSLYHRSPVATCSYLGDWASLLQPRSNVRPSMDTVIKILMNGKSCHHRVAGCYPASQQAQCHGCCGPVHGCPRLLCSSCPGFPRLWRG